MKLKIAVLTILFLGSAAYANQNENKKKCKELSEMSTKVSTRIYSLAEEIRIVPTGETEAKIVRSFYADDVTSTEDCKRHDANNEFKNIHYFQCTEEVKENDPGYSTVIDGVNHDGRVVGRTVEFCFAEL